MVAVLLVALAFAGAIVFSAYTAWWVERALPPLGRFVEVDGTRLHYLDVGSGPAVLMIHGLGGQMRNFTHSLVSRLSADHRVVVIDRPGAGYSTRAPGASATLRAQAATIAKFIAALQLERPTIVGHSLGGAIALALAIDHPDAVGRLALVAPLTHPQDSVPDAFKGLAIRSPIVRRIVAWTLAVPAALLARDTAMEPVFGPERAPADFASVGGGALWLRPKSFYGASTDLLAANHDLPDMLTRYGSLTLPVGILFGVDDRILDHRVHGLAMQGKIPGLALELVPGGHMLPVTQADLTAAWIRKTAAQAAPAGAAPAG